MTKRILILIAFLGFSWIGASKASNESISLEEYQRLLGEVNTNDNSDFSNSKLFISLGHKFFEPETLKFYQQSQKLTVNIKSYCDSLKGTSNNTKDQTETLKLQAQETWKESMLIWHRLSAAPFGPVTQNNNEIANAIYSWPLINECGIQTELIAIRDTGKFSPKSLFTSKGLMAVEYGLFGDTNHSVCNKKNKRFAKVHEWLTHDDQTKSLDMCNLALESAQDVEVNAQKLSEAWDPQLGNFTYQIVNGSKYENFTEALEELSHSLYNLEFMKDFQLGKPLGLHKDCTDASGKCPENIENKWSQTGLESIEAELIAFDDIFNNAGFGEFLTAQGFDSVYQDMMNQNAKTLNLISSLKAQGTLNELIEKADISDCKATTVDNPLVPVCALQKNLRALAVIYKSEFLPALALNAPATAQGDAD